jgi:hypothetical protein
MVSELDKWALGQLGAKLTWAILEDRFGFSRQSLQARSEVKAAYDNAKLALAGGLVETKEQTSKGNVDLRSELDRANLEIAEFKRKEGLWKQRWQRIAFHVRQCGVQIDAVDRAIPDGADVPTERAVTNILRPFDKEIPSSGRGWMMACRNLAVTELNRRRMSWFESAACIPLA